MMYDNHKKSGCGFEELLVSHLYGETNAAEKATFAAHLETCAACTDELAAFAGVKFSVDDWKLQEFAALETPVIEIPYESAQAIQKSAGVEVTWLKGLRDLFSLSPAWSLATASLALLAVFTGIALFAINSPKDNQIAEQGNKPLLPVSAPTVEKGTENSNNGANANKNPENEVKPAAEQKNTPAETVAVTPDAKDKKQVNKPDARRQPQKTEAANTPKSTDSKRNLKNSQQVAPKIIEEDEEDDTLRLAELFEEIDTVE